MVGREEGGDAVKTQTTGCVYRFHEVVGLHFADTETLYVTPFAARRLATALLRCADAVEDGYEYPTIDITEERKEVPQ